LRAELSCLAWVPHVLALGSLCGKKLNARDKFHKKKLSVLFDYGEIQQTDSVLLDDLDQGLIEFRQEVLLGGSKVFIRTDLDDQLNHIIPRRQR